MTVCGTRAKRHPADHACRPPGTCGCGIQRRIDGVIAPAALLSAGHLGQAGCGMHPRLHDPSQFSIGREVHMSCQVMHGSSIAAGQLFEHLEVGVDDEDVRQRVQDEGRLPAANHVLRQPLVTQQGGQCVAGVPLGLVAAGLQAVQDGLRGGRQAFSCALIV